MVPSRPNSPAEKRKGKVLTDKETKQVKKITKIPGIPGKRATALLALNEGKTMSEISKLSGISVGQVRYSMRRFYLMGMDMFKVVMDEPANRLPESKDEKKKNKKNKGKKKGKKSKKNDKGKKTKKTKKGKKNKSS